MANCGISAEVIGKRNIGLGAELIHSSRAQHMSEYPSGDRPPRLAQVIGRQTVRLHQRTCISLFQGMRISPRSMSCTWQTPSGGEPSCAPRVAHPRHPLGTVGSLSDNNGIVAGVACWPLFGTHGPRAHCCKSSGTQWPLADAWLLCW